MTSPAISPPARPGKNDVIEMKSSLISVIIENTIKKTNPNNKDLYKDAENFMRFVIHMKNEIDLQNWPIKMTFN